MVKTTYFLLAGDEGLEPFSWVFAFPSCSSSSSSSSKGRFPFGNPLLKSSFTTLLSLKWTKKSLVIVVIFNVSIDWWHLPKYQGWDNPTQSPMLGQPCLITNFGTTLPNHQRWDNPAQSPMLGQPHPITNIGTTPPDHQHWDNSTLSPTLGQPHPITNVGTTPPDHQCWDNPIRSPTLGQPHLITNIGTTPPDHQHWDNPAQSSRLGQPVFKECYTCSKLNIYCRKFLLFPYIFFHFSELWFPGVFCHSNNEC